MTNNFQLTYDSRLKNWYELRKSLEKSDLKTKCVEIDKFWQQTPLVNHYLHFDFMHEWPNPWELLAENNYCPIARGLGMVYTLLLLDTKNIEFAEATDYNSEDVILVLVDRAKYILNYWPNTVLNNNLSDFKIIKTIDIDKLKEKIGNI